MPSNSILLKVYRDAITSGSFPVNLSSGGVNPHNTAALTSSPDVKVVAEFIQSLHLITKYEIYVPNFILCNETHNILSVYVDRHSTVC